MSRFDIPERALETFERIHGLNVTVHDIDGSLGPFLNPSRFHHRSPLCLAVKARGHSGTCLRFEIEGLRRNLSRLPEGRVHVCPAGLVEWVVPVFEDEALKWVLFAGPRFPGRQFQSAYRAPLITWSKPPWSKNSDMPAPVDEDEAREILEHLCQLAARLRFWASEANPRHNVSPDFLIARETIVSRFMEDHYAETATLPMLARKLGLSESRTSHVVQESCGQSFRELLVQKRLRVAMDLLRQSEMNVLEVAMASGFEDVAHFHRLFRRRIGTTPARYRTTGRT